MCTPFWYHVAEAVCNASGGCLCVDVQIYIQRKMAMYRGVRPLILDTSKDHETALQEVESYLQWRNVLKSGDLYVFTSGMQMR